MALAIHWTLLAEEKLEDIFSYYKEVASVEIAQRIVSDIVERVDILANNPRAGQRED